LITVTSTSPLGVRRRDAGEACRILDHDVTTGQATQLDADAGRRLCAQRDGRLREDERTQANIVIAHVEGVAAAGR